jgi:hypothetical protein
MKPYKKELMILAAVMSFVVACGVHDKAVRLSPNAMLRSDMPIVRPVVVRPVQADTPKVKAVVNVATIKPVITPVIELSKENGKKIDRQTDLLIKLDKLVSGQGSANSKLDKVVTMLADERAGRVRAEHHADRSDSLVREYANQLRQQGERNATQVHNLDKRQSAQINFILGMFFFSVSIFFYFAYIHKPNNKNFTATAYN